jgi:hypothetical protein
MPQSKYLTNTSMNILQNLLNKTLVSEEIKLLEHLEDKYKFKVLFQNALDDFHKLNQADDDFKADFVLLVSQLIHTVNYQLRKIEHLCARQKSEAQSIILTIARGLQLEIGHSVTNFTDFMQLAVERAAYLHDYDEQRAKQELRLISQKQDPAPQNTQPQKQPVFEWHGSPIQLKILARQCVAKNWIEKEYDIVSFFSKNKPTAEKIICWNREHLYHLLILFDHLYTQKKWVRLSKGKGVWKALSPILRDFSKNPIENNLLKMRHRLFENYEHYRTQHLDIEQLIDYITASESNQKN